VGRHGRSAAGFMVERKAARGKTKSNPCAPQLEGHFVLELTRNGLRHDEFMPLECTSLTGV